MLTVGFYGVRGSTPATCDQNRLYGGNTSCVALEAPGQEPIVLDLGTGLRRWGLTLPDDRPFEGSALVSHIHWDHVQGLPFFGPVLREGARLDVYGPPQEGSSLEAAISELIRPPFFPVTVDELVGAIRFIDAQPGVLRIGDATVLVRPVPHLGPTYGYRVELGGAAVAYVPDHQMPLDGSHSVTDDVIELCDGADLVIHDAQFTVEEFAPKAHWGHCTVDYAVFVAARAGAKRLALFHHDPARDDAAMLRILRHACKQAEASGLDEVLAAHEGLAVSLSG